jgi:cytidine deaminase
MNRPNLSSELKTCLVDAAIQVRKNAYARYSNYLVGAALLTKSGQIFIGANVENAVFPLTTCAERSAVFSAVSTGEREFQAIAVVTRDGGMPCGSCRQVLAEFGSDIQVIIADSAGKIHQTIRVADLLPGAFGPQNLNSGG